MWKHSLAFGPGVQSSHPRAYQARPRMNCRYSIRDRSLTVRAGSRSTWTSNWHAPCHILTPSLLVNRSNRKSRTGIRRIATEDSVIIYDSWGWVGLLPRPPEWEGVGGGA